MRRFLGLDKKVNEAKKLAAQQAAEQQAAEQRAAAEQFTTAVAAIVENYKRDDFDANKQEIQQEIQNTLRNLSTTYSDEIVKLEYMSQLMRKIQDLDYDFGATSSPDQAKEKLVVIRYVDAMLEVYQKMEPEEVHTSMDSSYTRYPVMHEFHRKLFIEATLVKYKLLVTETTTAETAAAGQKTFFYNPADKLDDLEKYLFYAVSYADGDEQVNQVWRNIRALTYDADQKKLVVFCVAGDVDAMLQHYTYMVSKWGNYTEDNIKQIDSIVMQAVIEKLGTWGINIGNESVPDNPESYPNILAVCATLFSIRTIINIIPDNAYLDLAQKVNALLQRTGVSETMQQHKWWLPFLCNIERKLFETRVGDDDHVLDKNDLAAVKAAIENAQHENYSKIMGEYFGEQSNNLDIYGEYYKLFENLSSVHNDRYGVTYNEKNLVLLTSMFDAVEKNQTDIRYFNLLFTFMKKSGSLDYYVQQSGERFIAACKAYVALSVNINFEGMDYESQSFYRSLMQDLIKNCQDKSTKQVLEESLLHLGKPRLTEQAVEEKINLYLSGTLTLKKFKEDTVRDTDKVDSIIMKRIEAADPDALSLSELHKLNVMLGIVTVVATSLVDKQNVIQGKIDGFIDFAEANEPLNPLFEKLQDPIYFRIIVDPVIVSPSGHTYNKSELAEWMKKSNVDPNTNNFIIDSVAPNQAIANLLDEIYLQYQKVAAKEQEVAAKEQEVAAKEQEGTAKEQEGTAIDLQKMLEVAKAGVTETGQKDFMLLNCIDALEKLIVAEKTSKNKFTGG